MLYTSGFVNDVMFPSNGGNSSKSKTMRMGYVSFSSPGGGIGRSLPSC